ncbi:MAG: hypothetical protein ABFS09_10790 [Thermodesulfobacteriota bacterium]
MRGKTGVFKRLVLLGAGAFCLYFFEAVVLAQVALADSINALLEFDYTSVDTETMDKRSGQKTQTDSSSWGQKYNVDLKKSFFPNLRLTAGGIFEKNAIDSDLNGTERTLTWNNTRPYVDLTLDNRLYRAGVSYSKREDEQKSSGTRTISNINELYSAVLDWRPDGLPTFDLRVDKNDLYDKDRQFQDSTTTISSLNSRYRTDKFDIRYNPILQEYTDHIDNFELKTTTHHGRIGYADTFFNRRTNFGVTYNITDRHQKIIAHGTGELVEQILGITSGLFLENDTQTAPFILLPLPPPSIIPELIDGQFTDITAINLGTTSGTKRKHLGLEFVSPTEVNTLRVWVDQDLSLDPTVADWFEWEIYTSSDDNNSWQLEQTITQAPFLAAQTNNGLQYYFQIDFTKVTTQFIKVVVRPLSSGSPPAESILYPDINVTELQAFIREPLPDKETKRSSTTHMLNLDARTKLMEQFDLFHNISFFMTKTTPGEGERSTLSNILSASHRFNEKLRGNVRVLREEIKEIHASGYAHGYSASLRADPLKTLNNTLVFNGRQEKVGDDDTTRNSLFLQNRAAIYKGIDVFVDGGVSWQNNADGQDQETLTLNVGTDVVPHRSMTITANYMETNSDSSGGGLADSTKRTNRTDVGITWRPFQTVYIVASYGRVEQENRNDTLKNYSLNWSPFPYGTLQLRIDYSEELRTQDLSKLTTFRPSIRWEITPRIDLTVSFYKTESDSVFQTIDMESLNANIKIRY